MNDVATCPLSGKSPAFEGLLEDSSPLGDIIHWKGFAGQVSLKYMGVNPITNSSQSRSTESAAEWKLTVMQITFASVGLF